MSAPISGFVMETEKITKLHTDVGSCTPLGSADPPRTSEEHMETSDGIDGTHVSPRFPILRARETRI